MDIVRKGYKVSGFGSTSFVIAVEEAELARSTESRVYLKAGGFQAIETANTRWFLKKKEAYQFAHDKNVEKRNMLNARLVSTNTNHEELKKVLSSL